MVKEHIFLGQVMTADTDHEGEIVRTVRMGWSVLGRYGQFMNSNLPVTIKRKVCNSILPVLKYRIEISRATKRV